MTYLMPVDNLPLVLALGKGRANSMHLLPTCRVIAAHYIASKSQFVARWIHSEVNHADRPSRVSYRGKGRFKLPLTPTHTHTHT